MLLEFKCGNFRSFKDIVTFSMIGSRINELEESNVNAFGKYKVLKSAVIYGANASGKSNLIKAMSFMKNFVLNFFEKSQITDLIPIDFYKLSKISEKEPSFFEISFIQNLREYRYGFQLTKEKVQSEWLFITGKKKEITLFKREENDIKIGLLFKEGRGLIEKTRSNVLFLPVVAQFNGLFSKEVIKWFSKFNIINGLNDDQVIPFSLNFIKNNQSKFLVEKLIKFADFGIDGFDVQSIKVEEKEIPSEIKSKMPKEMEIEGIEMISLRTKHTRYDKDQKDDNIYFDLDKSESEGTKKIFALSGPLLNTLSKGKIIVVDEFDARFHPMITKAIISLFNSKINNPHNAQLIFATHDVKLLSNNIFRRDQIWFTEKNKYGASDLYSLVEYKVRNDATYEKDYLLGKYGAIPYIANFNDLWSKETNEKETVE
jgi:uncharacterized protein